MSLLKNQTSANPSLDFFGAGGGGGGSGPVISTSIVETSTITVSTIQAAGTITDFLAGSPAVPAAAWSVGIDGIGNSADVLLAPSTLSAYRDIALADSTGAPVQVLREQVEIGSAQIGYITNPAVPAATGLKFISSLNGGVDATVLLSATDRFPLGNQQIATSNTAICPEGAFGVPICAAFSTIANHVYQVSFGVQEQVGNAAGLGGAVNAEDRVSYTITDAVLDTILHSEISTLQVAQPRGRVITGTFQAGSSNAVVTISNNTGSALSTIYSGANNPAFLTLIDMGPQVTLP